MASRVNAGDREKAKKGGRVIPFSAASSRGGDVMIEKMERLGTKLRNIRGALLEARQTGNNAIYVAEKKDRFPDAAKAKQIGYAILYLSGALEKLSGKLMQAEDQKDGEEFVSLAGSAAFGSLLRTGWEQCRAGDDREFRAIYGIVAEAFGPLARKYGVEMKSYSKISKSDAGVDDIKKIEASLSETPKYISKKDAKEMLGGYMGKELDSGLEELLQMPEELVMKRGERYLLLADKAEMRSIQMLRALFGGPGERIVFANAGYGIAIEESTGHSYILFIDTSRKVAVKTVLSSMYEGKSGWDEFRGALKAALSAVAKIKKDDKKTFMVYDIDILKKEDISKL